MIKGTCTPRRSASTPSSCSIGSSNIDIRSFSINYEINAVLYSQKLAKKLEEEFERGLADCTEFRPAEYQRR